jgi:hypothetical protein
MTANNNPMPPVAALREASQTLSALSPANDLLTKHLQFVADMLAAAGPLPPKPLLLWREAGGQAQHALIGQELVVGRQPGEGVLALPADKLLSRRHFIIRAGKGARVLEDLKSHNGTAINRPDNRVQQHTLRDGDLICAGQHTFVFLDQGRTS